MTKLSALFVSTLFFTTLVTAQTPSGSSIQSSSQIQKMEEEKISDDVSNKNTRIHGTQAPKESQSTDTKVRKTHRK